MLFLTVSVYFTRDRVHPVNNIAEIPLVALCHDTSRHVTTRYLSQRILVQEKFVYIRAVSHVLCSTLDTARRDERDERDTSVTTSVTSTTRNSICCVMRMNFTMTVICFKKRITVIITFNVSYSLIYWSIYLFNFFHLT